MSARDTIEDPDRGLRGWLRDYARQHPRWGHRRAYHDARAQGWVINHKKVQRLWRQEGLCVPVPRRRKRAGSSTHLPVPTAEAPNVVWAIDFQYDSTTDGRPIKILSAVDEHTRECLGGLVERSVTAERLANELDVIVADRGVAPRVLRLDNGPEMIAAALAEWAGTRTGMLFIPPGEPWRNPFIESFNGRLRDECLNINVFWSLAHARIVIGDWKQEYNHHRPHSALGYQPLARYAASCRHLTPGGYFELERGSNGPKGEAGTRETCDSCREVGENAVGDASIAEYSIEAGFSTRTETLMGEERALFSLPAIRSFETPCWSGS